MSIDTKVVNFRFKREEVNTWDKFARENQLNRTNLIRRAVDFYIQSDDVPANGAMEQLIAANTKLKSDIKMLKDQYEKSHFERAKSALTTVEELKNKLAKFANIDGHPTLEYLTNYGFKMKDVRGNENKVNTLKGLLDHFKKYISQ